MLHKDLISPPPSQQHSLSLYKDPFSLSYSQKPAKTRARWPKITIFLKVPENLRPLAPLPYSRAIVARAVRVRCWECSGTPSPPPLENLRLVHSGTCSYLVSRPSSSESYGLLTQAGISWLQKRDAGTLNFISEKRNRVKNEYNDVVLNNWCCNLMLFPFVLLQSS